MLLCYPGSGVSTQVGSPSFGSILSQSTPGLFNFFNLFIIKIAYIFHANLSLAKSVCPALQGCWQAKGINQSSNGEIQTRATSGH